MIGAIAASGLGCGGGSYSASGYSPSAGAAASVPASEPMWGAPGGAVGSSYEGEESYGSLEVDTASRRGPAREEMQVQSTGATASGDSSGGESTGGIAGLLEGGMDAPPAAPVIDDRVRYAQAETSTDDETRPTPRAQASDGNQVPLLIYTARLQLTAHQITDKQDRVEAIAREHGGFLASRTNDTIIVRVPARAFDAAMAQIQELGDVVARFIEVSDVSEEFHDVTVRIQTLEAMRARVEQLLAQANDVQQALAVEQQLERITLELERMRGRLRFLSDRVAYSTITVVFRERTTSAEPQFQLPFRWLQGLGLDRLLTL